MKTLFSASALTLAAMATAVGADTAPQPNCIDPSIETIGIFVNNDGVRFSTVVGDPMDFMVNAAKYPENVLPVEDMTELGFISFGVEDVYRDVESMFDGDLEIARSDFIKSDPDASILKTNTNTYVLYDRNTIDWSDPINQVAFMNAYGIEMSGNVNKLVNAMNTGMFQLNNIVSVCSVQTTELESNKGMLRPLERPQIQQP